MIINLRIFRDLFWTGLVTALLISGADSFAQPSQAGILPSERFGIILSESVIRVGGIDYDSVQQSDARADRSGLPYRFAVMIPVDIDPNLTGHWVSVPGHGKLWHLTIVSEGAAALAPYYDDFSIPPGGELSIYHDASSGTSEVYTYWNTPHETHFATEFILGPSLTFEYFEPQGVIGSLRLHVSDIAYAYRGVGSPRQPGQRGFGDSGSCEVNSSCDEGNSWRDEKNAVVRIAVRNGTSVFWCTGALVNNTFQDFEPYILTADHCAYYSGKYANASDLDQWIFYFNFESPECADPVSEPSFNTQVGATLLAHGGNTGDTGSDFYLVVLKNKVPGSYNPFFLGWDRQNIASPQGVCLHHPQGDIKKISTYTQPVVTSQWNNNELQSHWRVKWSETYNGFGVTEGGSSGAPLFNGEGLVVGTLTGGDASCINTSGADYFGKFSYHWESNGIDPASRLSPWLDPGNTGILKLQGTYYSNITIAAFKADTSVVPVGGRLDFIDLSAGKPAQWEWYFEGGDPSSSDLQNPAGIQYKSFGTYDVSLIISNEVSTDTLVKMDYIIVEPVVSPNPSFGQFRIFFGEADISSEMIEVYNSMGQRIRFTVPDIGKTSLLIDLHGHPSGTYFIRFRSDDFQFSNKITLIH